MSVLRAIAVFLCGFLSLRMTRAQIIMPGVCPEIKAMDNFNSTKYLGKWYEAEKYFFVYQFGGKCVTADFKQTEEGIVGVVNKQISIMSGLSTEIKGQLSEVSRSDEARLTVSFPSLPYQMEAPYWVLSTDYDNYSVIWSCVEFGLFHTVNTWILTRKRKPSIEVLEKAYKILDKNHISRAYLLRTNQQDCPGADE